MTELEYMRDSLADLYDRLEKLLQKYGDDQADSNDPFYRDLSDIVFYPDAPNDALRPRI